MAAPTFVDSAANGVNGSSGTSIIISFTNAGDLDVVGEAADDYAIAILYKESTAAYTATPSGWTQVSGAPWDQDTGGFKYRADMWWKKLTGSEGAETWSWSGSAWRYGEVHVYRGLVTTENPVITVSADEETNQTNNPVNPGLTIARTDSGLFWGVWNFSDIGNTAAPTGFTYRIPSVTVSLNRNIIAYDDLTTSPGSSGTVTGNLSGTIDWPLTVLVEIATQAAATLPPGLGPDLHMTQPLQHHVALL